MSDGDLFYATAVGRYFKVYKDGVYVSQHTTEREAADRCHNLCFRFPEATIKYVHEYEVNVGLTDAGITEAQSYTPAADTPPTISSTPSPSFIAGTADTYDLTQHVTDDGVSAVTYTLSNILPNGLSLNEAAGILTYDGTEPATTSQHTLIATDAVGSDESSSFDVAVNNVSGFPLFNVYSDLIQNAGGTPVAENNTRYWDKPVYPSYDSGNPAHELLSSVSALNTRLGQSGANGQTLFLDNTAVGGDITIPSGRTGVTICPETRDGVEMANNRVIVYGSDCNVYGFIWNGGDGSNGAIEIRGRDNVAAYNTFDGANNNVWLLIREWSNGATDNSRNRLCYNTFQNKNSNGSLILVDLSAAAPQGNQPKYTRIDHNTWLNNLYNNASTGHSQCQMGQSDGNLFYYGLFDNNYIYRHVNLNGTQTFEASGNKTIKFSSSGNIIIQNVFYENNSRAPTTRQGDFNYLYANWVIGNGNNAPRSGGTTIRGTDSLVACNYYSAVNYANVYQNVQLRFEDGDATNPPNSGNNLPADRAEMSFNTVYDGTNAIAWEGGGMDDTKMYNNAVTHRDASAVRVSNWGTDPTFGGNVWEATVPAAVTNLGGVTEATPQLTPNNGYQVPTASGNLDGQGVNTGYSSLITVDILGNPIPANNPNVGCFQAGYELTTDPVQAIIDTAGASA